MKFNRHAKRTAPVANPGTRWNHLANCRGAQPANQGFDGTRRATAGFSFPDLGVSFRYIPFGSFVFDGWNRYCMFAG
ncbi:hypothetical protein [Parapedobacter koreensis]|uniref:hypothetical protein n=1 Tax=Parapedobacter koreensis TaxID=332977 RepID=UPI000B83DDC1|nr:hypothetical protein [Parapedobacter koreensis]